jgi:hypothetical protein
LSRYTCAETKQKAGVLSPPHQVHRSFLHTFTCQPASRVDSRSGCRRRCLPADPVVPSKPFLCAVIELRRARTLMGRHLRRVLEGASVDEVGGDPGGSVAVDRARRPIIPQGIRLPIGLSQSAVPLWPPGAEQPSLQGDAGGSNVYAQHLG